MGALQKSYQISSQQEWPNSNFSLYIIITINFWAESWYTKRNCKRRDVLRINTKLLTAQNKKECIANIAKKWNSDLGSEREWKSQNFFPSQLVNSYLALERNMIKYHKTKTKLITAVNQITKGKNSKEKQEKCISDFLLVWLTSFKNLENNLTVR